MMTLKQTQPIITSLYRILVGSYGISIILLLIGRLLIGEQLPAIAYLNSIIHLMLMPALILLPLSIIFRFWGLVATLVPVIAAFGIWYIPYFLPKTPPANIQADFTILSYNLMGSSQNLEHIATIIIESNADIVAIQELTFSAEAYLGAALAETYPHQALHPDSSPVVGQGLFSRYPILTDAYWITRQGHQRTELDINGTPITVYNTHVAFPFITGGFKNRAHDVQSLITMANQETNPTLIIGDFNMTDRSEPYKQIIQQFHDAHLEVNQGFGFTYIPFFANIPLARIDYAFHDNRLEALSLSVVATPGPSDHHPIEVSLAIKP